MIEALKKGKNVDKGVKKAKKVQKETKSGNI